MKKLLYTVAGVALVVGLYGAGYYCGQKRMNPFYGMQKVETQKTPLVATVGNKKIYLSDVQKLKDSIPQLKEAPLEMVFSQLRDVVINNVAILELAKQENFLKNQAVVDEVKKASEQALVRIYLQQKIKESMTREKLFNLYKESLKEFVPEDEIKARHILVETEAEANQIISDLKKGADFAKIANEKSIDQGASKNGGELGYFVKEMMVPEFGKVVFAMKKGEITSKPIRTQFGWHVVEVEDRRMAPPPAFVEMEDLLKKKYAEQALPEILKQEKAKVQIKLEEMPSLEKEFSGKIEKPESETEIEKESLEEPEEVQEPLPPTDAEIETEEMDDDSMDISEESDEADVKE